MIAFLQLYYEIDNFCTSIVAENINGTIFHARNLDYSLPGLENITADVAWVKGGKTVFHSTQHVQTLVVLPCTPPAPFPHVHRTHLVLTPPPHWIIAGTRAVH